MSVFEFEIHAAGHHDLNDQLLDKMFRAGLEDATIAQRAGVLVACFDREADTWHEAVTSAVREFTSAGLAIDPVVIPPHSISGEQHTASAF